jgi:hypothetical protein
MRCGRKSTDVADIAEWPGCSGRADAIEAQAAAAGLGDVPPPGDTLRPRVAGMAVAVRCLACIGTVTR